MQKRDYKLHPSLFYCVFLAVMLLASVAILLLLPMNVSIKVLMVVVVSAYGVNVYWRYVLLRGAWSVVMLSPLEGRSWQVTTRTSSLQAKLRGDSTITSIVSVLRFDFPDRRWPVSCMVFRDSLDSEDYRRLVGAIRMTA